MPTDPAPNNPNPAETLLWKGHTSQWVHAGLYLACLLIAAAAILAAPYTQRWSLAALVIPALLAPGRWLLTRSTTYELTSQRLRITSGILNRRLDELELYRVKDYVLEQPFLLRLLGLGNLTLITSDATTPTVSIRAVPGVTDVREKLRNAVQLERDRKRVRELDVDGPGLSTEQS